MTSTTKIFRIRKVKKWTKEEDEELKKICQSKLKIDMQSVRKNFKGKSKSDCLSRISKIGADLKKGRWTREEDQQILRLISKHGKKWSKLGEEMKSRSGKQIRDRYINMLDEKLNTSKFTLDEDIRLLDLQREYGNKWSFFTQFFKNRNPDKLKNRFNSSIRRKKKLFYFLKSLDDKVIILILHEKIFSQKLQNF
jgi:hypothetical protein